MHGAMEGGGFITQKRGCEGLAVLEWKKDMFEARAKKPALLLSSEDLREQMDLNESTIERGDRIMPSDSEGSKGRGWRNHRKKKVTRSKEGGHLGWWSFCGKGTSPTLIHESPSLEGGNDIFGDKSGRKFPFVQTRKSLSNRGQTVKTFWTLPIARREESRTRGESGACKERSQNSS